MSLGELQPPQEAKDLLLYSYLAPVYAVDSLPRCKLLLSWDLDHEHPRWGTVEGDRGYGDVPMANANGSHAPSLYMYAILGVPLIRGHEKP